MAGPGRAVRSPGGAIPGIVVGAALACALFWLQLRTLYVTQTASYDTLLYARSLWAMFSSDGFNSVYGTHWLGIHANLLMYPLAAFARLVEPATLLAGQHAAAMGVTVVLVDRSLRRHGATHHLAKALATTALSILFVGAFTFDPRPESVAVPLGFALFDRLDQRREWDVNSWLLATALVLTREEFGLVIAGGIFMPGLNATGRKQSAAAAAIGFVWFCAYSFGVRPAVDSAFASDRAATAASDLFGTGDSETLLYRGAVIGALATMGGAALVRAPRWVLVAAPGIAWLLAIDKGGVDALRYHYSMLALPALLAASVHADRDGARGARAGWAMTGVQALGLLWLLPRVAAGFWIVSAPEQAALSAARAMLATVPEGAGLAAPYMISAGEADREVIYSEETMIAALRSDAGLPDAIDVVALSPSGQSIARFLVGREGFRLAAPPTALILLERGPDSNAVSPTLLSPAEPVECADPSADFPEQGVRICAVQRDETNGRLRLLVHRYATPGAARWTWMALSPEIQSPVSIMAGLVLPSQLPAGAWVWAMTDQPWMTSAQPQFQLVFADDSGDGRR